MNSQHTGSLEDKTPVLLLRASGAATPWVQAGPCWETSTLVSGSPAPQQGGGEPSPPGSHSSEQSTRDGEVTGNWEPAFLGRQELESLVFHPGSAPEVPCLPSLRP